MKRILYSIVHPNLERSKANQFLWDYLPNQTSITKRDLYELYPDFMISVADEKKALLSHDVIVFQHPIYWYSSPPLLKHWLDTVLEHGWAYGKGGTHLQGKIWCQVLTTGGSQEAYSLEGFHGHSLSDFLLPFQRSAELCGMEYKTPFVVHNTFHLKEAQLQEEGERFVSFIQKLLG